MHVESSNRRRGEPEPVGSRLCASAALRFNDIHPNAKTQRSKGAERIWLGTVLNSVSLGLLLGVPTLVFLTCDHGGGKVSVSFVNQEASYGPPFSNVKCERLAFAVRNDGTLPAAFVVSDIKDDHGNWIPSFHILGDAAASQTTHLYLYLPQGSHPLAVRLRRYQKASAVQKAQYALRLLIEKSSGHYPGKQVWFDKLSVPASEFIVKVDNEADPSRLSQ
jgi:hypothetical protein